MNGAPEANAIGAVVTTFRPDAEFPARVEAIRPQVGRVIIVDDGARPENVTRLDAWFGDRSDITVCHHRENSGLAAALNTGVSTARQMGCTWVLTLDDDTLVSPNMLARLAANMAQLGDGKPIGLVGMSWTEAGLTGQEPAPANRKPWVEKRAIITSGSLFSLAAYEAIGPFREDYFIDGIDYEYCMRARARGFRVVRCAEIGFQQRRGTPNVVKVGRFSITTYNYSAQRCYYQFRNSVMNVRASFFREPAYALASLISLSRVLLTTALLEADGGRKAEAMLRGIWHGMAGRMGRMPADS